MTAAIHITIDPVITEIGPFVLRWYGLIMALAVMVGALVFARQLARRGIDAGHTVGMLLWAIPAGVIGARAVHVLDHALFYWQHPTGLSPLSSSAWRSTG